MTDAPKRCPVMRAGGHRPLARCVLAYGHPPWNDEHHHRWSDEEDER